MSRPATYQVTQDQLDRLFALQQQNQRRGGSTGSPQGRRLTWRERLTGRARETAQQQAEHTYAGRYKSYAPLRFLKPYHPDDLDYETLEWLADFYAVRPALQFIITTILAAVKNATIECKDPDIVAFLQELILPKFLDLWEKSAKAFTYGASFNEVIRRGEEVVVEREDDETGETVTAYQGYALLIDEIRHNYIQTVTDVWKDERGKLAGYTQDRKTDVPTAEEAQGGQVGLRQPDSTSWCFVYSINDMENPVWGKAELRLVYSLAYWVNTFISLAMRRGEKEAGGAIVGHAPVGTTDVEGTEVDNLEHMADILSQLSDHLVTVFPFEVDEITKQLKWGFEEVALSERADIAVKMIEYLGKWIFLTLLVPPDALEVATKPYGSRSAVQTLFDAFLIRMQGLADRWADQAEVQLLNPLAREHFGQQAPKVQLVLVLSAEQKETLRATFTELLKSHADMHRLDLAQMAENLGVPVKKEEETTPTPAPQQPPGGAPESEEEGEEESPEPTLTLTLESGKPWNELVDEARLLLEVGLPEKTHVEVGRDANHLG